MIYIKPVVKGSSANQFTKFFLINELTSQPVN